MMMPGGRAFAPLPFAMRRRGLGHPDADGIRGRQGCGSSRSERGRYVGKRGGGQGVARYSVCRGGGTVVRDLRGRTKGGGRKRRRARSRPPASSLFNPWFVFPNPAGHRQICHNITPTRVQVFPCTDKLSHHSFIPPHRIFGLVGRTHARPPRPMGVLGCITPTRRRKRVADVA